MDEERERIIKALERDLIMSRFGVSNINELFMEDIPEADKTHLSTYERRNHYGSHHNQLFGKPGF